MIKGEHGIHTNSPHWPPNIFLKKWLREFVKRSEHFVLSYHSVNSPNLFLVMY